jgi:hypothetical protein
MFKEDFTALNAISPYFTMFPLSFPDGILRKNASSKQVVLDPFCGRGTTNFAARLLRLPTFGVDTSPVAIAATQARLARATPESVIKEAKRILTSRRTPFDIPNGAFWTSAFHPQVLYEICLLREALAAGQLEPQVRHALTGIMLGALHGPLGKKSRSYLSNQCPRTYAPKPAYAVRYWQARRMKPPSVDVVSILAARAHRYYGTSLPRVLSDATVGDSRDLASLKVTMGQRKADWIITSPPYYGLRTYVADQWLRAWLLGGPSQVDYGPTLQLNHGSASKFADELRKVWRNVNVCAASNARMVIRFGTINDRPVDPVSLIKESLGDTGWRITTIRSAGTALDGKRQAATFVQTDKPFNSEIDVYCRLVN